LPKSKEKSPNLRQDLAAGRLTEEQFKARLRELMVEDEEGNWWMVGYETGEWYRHDGTDWVRADPPGRVVPKPVPSPEAQWVSPPGHVVPRPAPSPEAKQASTLAAASLIASILGITIFPIIPSIIGIILGGMARKRMRAGEGTKTTKGLAKAGIVLGWVGIVLIGLGTLCYVLFFVSMVSVGDF
jgi:hypothetical protein